ncbi:organic cation transporter protein-like [Saccoglossus kowalevskii]
MKEHMTNLNEMCSDFEDHDPAGHASVFALFKTPILRKRSLIIIINWFAFGLMYYGISMNIDFFAKDPYTIFVFTGFVEIPAGFFTGWLLARYGRRATISVAMIVSGITFLIGGVLSGVASVLFTSAIVAKFIAKMCITGLTVYTSELVPTSIRAQANAIARCSSFIGAIVAPYIMILDTVWYLAPFLLIGIPSIVSGILLLLLPDTLDKTAPETIEDVEYPYE